jgi:hypothetical protein
MVSVANLVDVLTFVKINSYVRCLSKPIAQICPRNIPGSYFKHLHAWFVEFPYKIVGPLRVRNKLRLGNRVFHKKERDIKQCSLNLRRPIQNTSHYLFVRYWVHLYFLSVE